MGQEYTNLDEYVAELLRQDDGNKFSQSLDAGIFSSNFFDAEGLSLAIMVAKAGAARCAKALVKREECNFARTDQDGRGPLHWAGIKGNGRILKTYLKCCEIDRQDADGFSALMHAAAKGGTAAQVVLKGGGDPRLTGDQGINALMIAARWGRIENVKRLASKTDLSYRDKQGRTALDWAKIYAQEACVTWIRTLENQFKEKEEQERLQKDAYALADLRYKQLCEQAHLNGAQKKSGRLKH